MSFHALNIACASFTLGRMWNVWQEELGRAKWWQWLMVYSLTAAFWPLVWLSFGLDWLSFRWRWFGVRWRRLFSEDET